jgi:cytochrome c
VNGSQPTSLAISILFAMGAHALAAEGNATRGQRMFGACAACHSLEPDKNMTGPSLARLWGRKAGTLPSFSRYSPALKSSNIEWDDKTLNEWIADPQHVVPDNQMTFPGIQDAGQRSDLVAFLKEATRPGASQLAQGRGGGMSGGGMRGMMGGGQAPNLRNLEPSDRVQSIFHCKDTFTVTTVDGKTHKFWERNLRLKIDTSDDGPEKNAPALIAAGMMGDRADVIFADPGEISGLIAAKCE